MKNKSFQLLSAIGIILVVFGHSKNSLLLFGTIFPFYSFHMALFAFISGYFFKNQNFIFYVKKKTKKLLIPYFLYRFFYAFVIFSLMSLNIINFGEKITLYNLFIAPFTTTGNQYFFNVASWFVLAIYFVQLINLAIYKCLFKFNEKTRNIIIAIIYLILWNVMFKFDNTGIFYTINRVLFLLPFYHFGFLYKKYLEKYDNVCNFVYFSILFIIQAILFQLSNGNLNYNLNLLYFNNYFYIHFLSSLTGIMFWLRISKVLSKFIDNKYYSVISDNTFCIMMNHMFCIFLTNFFVVVLYFINIKTINFNLSFINDEVVCQFRNSMWFLFASKNTVVCLIYGIIGVMLPILIKQKLCKLKKSFNDKKYSDVKL